MRIHLETRVSLVDRSTYVGDYGNIYTDTYYNDYGEEIGSVSYHVKHGQEIHLVTQTELLGNSFTYPSVQVAGGKVEEDVQSEEYPDTSDINF
jgi:hypothetical protein